MTSITHKLARGLLADQGIGLIWKLHSDAATAARIGNSAAALALSEIAEAAEREWLRQVGRARHEGQSLTYKCPRRGPRSAITHCPSRLRRLSAAVFFFVG